LPELSAVTIAMYHFVRPAAKSRWPRLVALEANAFREQLRYIRRHYTAVGLGDLAAAAKGSGLLPPRSIVLTFDDGYSDHYAHVFPLLTAERMRATFFPVRTSLLDRTLLDPNKIQFILAAVNDPHHIVEAIDAAIAASTDPAIRTPSDYRAQWWIASRYDVPAVVYVKRMLQHGLPSAVRRPLVDALFQRFVTSDEAAFADELYFTVDQACEMRAAGMEFGAHGDRHVPLTTLDRAGQAAEIDGALKVLDAVGVARAAFAYSYVKGQYNQISLDLLRRRGCGAAVTTRVDLAQPGESDLLTLPRIDANDLPVDGDAPPNEWTERATAPG
jgi:peptidoglycan/xylan/chitin deacetylase (PgdA/CDA1 family)